MLERTSDEPRGLLDSLTGIASTLVAILQTRLDLLAVDLEDDLQRFLSLLMLALGTIFCLGVGVVLSAMVLVVMFWDTHRLLLLTGLAVLFLGAGAAVGALARKKAKAAPRIFASSLEELRKDGRQLASRS
jgi:uncharacterized membrane protein YqjE